MRRNRKNYRENIGKQSEVGTTIAISRGGDNARLDVKTEVVYTYVKKTAQKILIVTEDRRRFMSREQRSKKRRTSFVEGVRGKSCQAKFPMTNSWIAGVTHRYRAKQT